MAIDTRELPGLHHGRVHIGTGRTLLVEGKIRLIMAISTLQGIIFLKSLPFTLSQVQATSGKLLGSINRAGNCAPEFLGGLDFANHLV